MMTDLRVRKLSRECMRQQLVDGISKDCRVSQSHVLKREGKPLSNREPPRFIRGFKRL
jgi:hypothetical protein